MLIRELFENDESTRIKVGGSSEAARAWINKVYAKYPHTMQNNHVMVWGSGDDQQFAMFELVPSFSKRGAVEVKWFQAYPLRQGVGSKAMKELQTLAREDGIALTLFPWDKGQVSQAKLTKFYRGQGFKPTVKGGKAMAWETNMAEVSDELRNRYVARASDDYGNANFAARASKSHPGLEDYSREQEQRAKKRAAGLNRALSDKRLGREPSVAEDLDEAVGGNYLYHATSASGLKGMLSSGSIRSATGPQAATSAQTKLPTVSVTRDWGYASGAQAQTQLGGIGRDAILVLDRNAVESNFKTLGTSQSTNIKGLALNPYLKKDGEARSQNTDPMARTNANAKAKYAEPTAKAGGEFEEAVVVPKGALPLKGTMVGFWINPKSELMKDSAIMNDPRRLDMPRPNQFVKATQQNSVAEGRLNEFAPGAGDEGGEDPYRYPKPKRYARSADYFGQFEADHFDREDFDDAAGVFKGYWGSTPIAYFKFADPARTSGNDPGMGWYYEPESNGSSDAASAAPAVDRSAERKQQELGMIDKFLKSGQTPKPGSQIYSMMKRHGLA